MLSKNRKKTIITVGVLSIAMILANILHAGTVSFVPLETKDLSSDDIDEGIYQAPDNDEEVETVRNSWIPGDPIYIDDTNYECDWKWAKAQGLCSGWGTEMMPYVIEDLTIDGGGSATGSCITIKNSYACFRIEDCILYGSGFGGKDAAIRLINTRNGEIINNDISQNTYGTYGIWLKDSNYNRIENNALNENFVGIILQDSNENIIFENTLSDHHIGILIMGTSSSNTIYFNEFYRSSYRHAYYWLYSGSGNSWDNGFVGNYWDDYEEKYPAATNDGIKWDHPYFIYRYNADRYPLTDLSEVTSPIHIDDSDTNCNWQWAKNEFDLDGDGSYNDPYVIKNLIIEASWEFGIFIENSNVHFRIENCRIYTFWGSMAGIKLYKTTNGKIINNDCLDYFQYGIYLEDSNDNNVSGNTCNNNYDGIRLEYSNENILSENTCNDNEYGIHLRDYGANNIISGNTLNGNELYGIYLEGHSWESCWGNIISENTANDNTFGIYALGGGDSEYPNIFLGNTANYNGCGIRFFNSHYNVVSYNTASYNTGSGITLDYLSSYNYGIGNYLPNNVLGPISYGYGATGNNIGYTE